VTLNIAATCIRRERAYGSFKSSATCISTVSDGVEKAQAEVIFADGGCELIERQGKDLRIVARLALQRTIVEGCKPFKCPIFLRIDPKHAEDFLCYGHPLCHCRQRTRTQND
jgi:hypothetical protein